MRSARVLRSGKVSHSVVHIGGDFAKKSSDGFGLAYAFMVSLNINIFGVVDNPCRRTKIWIIVSSARCHNVSLVLRALAGQI